MEHLHAEAWENELDHWHCWHPVIHLKVALLPVMVKKLLWGYMARGEGWRAIPNYLVGGPVIRMFCFGGPIFEISRSVTVFVGRLVYQIILKTGWSHLLLVQSGGEIHSFRQEPLRHF